MRYFSVCSGIEAATVAWEPLGWKPAGFSEIEPFPSAVLAHHYPSVKNYGDMTKCDEWEIENGADVVVGGTPCQSFSIAGKRGGMDDSRGKLAVKFFDIVRKLRPRWIVWENVPGVLSSNKGRDFGQFLSEMGKCGYGFAYRILDAQYFGVAQRRRRVFVVAHIGDWRPSTAVLFEPQGLCGSIEKSRKKKKEIAGTITAGFGKNRNNSEELVCTKARKSKISWPAKISPTINAHFGEKQGLEDQHALSGTGMFVNPQSIRRLTPIECERLQGFPDGYTKIAWRGNNQENCPDGPRYKALGNSMAVPVMEWIGRRISIFERIKNGN